MSQKRTVKRKNVLKTGHIINIKLAIKLLSLQLGGKK
jgi:hypothetical protein